MEGLRPTEVFGRRLREARNALGWTQQQLADRLTEMGRLTDRATIARSEKGQTTAGLDFVMAVAAAVHAAPVWLLTPKDDEAAIALAPCSPFDAVPAAAARAWIRGARLLPGSDVLDVWPHVPDSERRAYVNSAPPNTSALLLAVTGQMDYDTASRVIDELDDAADRHRKEEDDG